MQTDSDNKPFKLRPGRFVNLAIILFVMVLLATLAVTYLNFGGPEMPLPPSLRVIGIWLPGR